MLLLANLSEEASTSVLKSELGPLYEHFAAIKELMEVRGTQAKMPYSIDF